MGWSCSYLSARTLDAISAFCVHSTGCSNMYEHKGRRYFYENSRREHPGGDITGTVYVLSGNMSRKVGSFKIDGAGIIVRWPHKPVPFTDPRAYFAGLKAQVFPGNCSFAVVQDGPVSFWYNLLFPYVR